MSFNVEILHDPVGVKFTEDIGEDELAVITPNNISPILRSKLPETWQPSPCILSTRWNNIGERIKNFEVYEDDVWLLSYPKSGTTWSQEMVWLICNNLDYEGAKENILHRFPMIDIDALLKPGTVNIDGLEAAGSLKRPRFIKCHLPISLLPDQIWIKKPKMVYIARNPKDLAISAYHFFAMLGYAGTIDDFMEAFISNRIFYSPLYNHVADYHAIKSELNILFLTYEEMKKDIQSVIIRTAEFFNTHITDIEVNTMMQHLSFESMKNNSSVNYEPAVERLFKVRGIERPENTGFMRKGIVGSWKSELPAIYADKIDQQILEKCSDKELLSILLNS